MSEMVERVARAICKSRTCEGFMCCQWPASGGRLNCPVKSGGYDDAAKEAIVALREPTEQMLFMAHKATGGDILVGQIREVWRAMIDAEIGKPW